MASFGLLPETRPDATRDPRPAVLGLAFASALAWLLTPVLRFHTLSWTALWILATRSTIPVLAATAAVVWIAARLLSEGTERERLDLALDVACVATWLPPLFLFFRQESPWAAAIAAILAVAATRALLVRSIPPTSDAVGTLAPAVGAAICLQAGIAAVSVDDWRSCAVALATASMFLTWIFTTRGLWRPRASRRRNIRVIPALLVGVSFSAGGLTRYLAHPPGSGSGSGHGAAPDGLISMLFGAPRPKRGDDRPMRRPPGDTPAIVDGESWPGVVLWPDVQKYVTLVAPLPRPGISLFDKAKQLDSRSIPFYGAYWYFKGPGDPPANSFVTHGNPAQLSFRSTDFAPLTMEARQNFGRMIELSCCSAMGVAIENGDKYFATVTLELELRNSTIAESPWLTLGEAPVSAAASQTLKFPIPPRLRNSRFDEIEVRFHLLQPRADRSARIALRRFIFLR